ncbi:MAG: anti-sigma factor [Hansschlegelia sp.]
MSAVEDIEGGAGDPPDREGLAAEYALGTLDAVERAPVAARLDVDPDLAEAVERWELRLAPLTLLVPSVAPPAGLWPAIERRLNGLARFARPAPRPSAAPTVLRPSGGWRSFALAASLAALVLGGLLARELVTATRQPTEPLVAMLSSDGKEPGFLVSVDVAKRELTIRRVGAAQAPNHSHELWLVSDKVGKPVSLGVVGPTSSAVRLASYDPNTFEGATYAISVEPEGGSKTGQPTGPVVFSGKLVELPPTTAH